MKKLPENLEGLRLLNPIREGFSALGICAQGWIHAPVITSGDPVWLETSWLQEYELRQKFLMINWWINWRLFQVKRKAAGRTTMTGDGVNDIITVVNCSIT